MPLIACPDCSTEVSDLAIACPRCARPIAGQSNFGSMQAPSASQLSIGVNRSLPIPVAPVSAPGPTPFPKGQHSSEQYVHNDGLAASFNVKFKKRRVGSFGYGQWRGDGILTISTQGVTIQGKHVKTLAARWGIGFGISIAVLVITFGMFAPGVLIMYPLVEYVILDRETISLPWSQIPGWGSQGTDIAIEMGMIRFKSPAVFESSVQPQIRELLLKHAPEKERR